jgi:MFS family permease
MVAKAKREPSRHSENKWIILAILVIAQFMVVLDIAIVNVALPSIFKDLHFSSNNLQWVITAYTLTFGGFLLLGGRAADLFGRRKIFISAVTGFFIASLLCGLAQSETQLIISSRFINCLI